jgi:hypothetical protein
MKPKVNFIWMMVKHMIIDKNINLFIVILYLKIMNFNQRMFIIDIYLTRNYLCIFFLRSLDTTAKFDTDAWVERIVILGYPKNPSRVAINSGDKQAVPLHSYEDASQTLIIRRPGPAVATDWTLTLS